MAFDARFAWDEMPDRLKEEYNFDFNNFQKESRLCLYLLIIIAVIFILVGSLFDKTYGSKIHRGMGKIYS